ncbi:EAL domain-containing protein [Devosia sp.]|uniref:EAL domain-containing protein n=1 Tax=Devosia sp. TaxID=1871048 RepID=UPI003A95D769
MNLLPDRVYQVAIVDTDAGRRKELHDRLINDTRFELHDVGSLDDLLTLAGRLDLDCVLIASKLGDLTGFAVNEKLTMACAEPPAAIMIANSRNERSAIKAFRSGFQDYLKRDMMADADLQSAITRVAKVRRERQREKLKLAQLSEMAMRDALTGLSNRNALEDHLKIMMEAGLRHGKPFAIILMDVNRFKSINDTFGHFIGDHALKAFADRLQQTARHSDVFGRLGGDEFLYLIGEGVSIEAIRSACARLSRALTFDIELEHARFSMQASIGAAIYPIDGKTVEDLIKAADGAMYAAKRSETGTCLAIDRPALEILADAAEPDGLFGKSISPNLTPDRTNAAEGSEADAATDQRTEPAAATPVKPQTTARAFVIDDDPQIRGIIRKALERRGYASTEYVTLKQIEAALGVLNPELIVLDLTLGETDAIAVMQRIGQSQFDGHILLISGHDIRTLQQVQQLGEAAGHKMLPVLRKPFRIREFSTRIDALQTATAQEDVDGLLSLALDKGWLEVWYQPQIDLKTMTVIGSEALARIRHPERGILHPHEFLPPPSSRHYKQFGQFVIETALNDWGKIAAPSIARGQQAHRVAVNVPSALLLSPGFVERIRAMLPDSPQFPGMTIELTENETIADPTAVSKIAVQLRLNKISMSIDDFGAGESTITRLAQLPFAEIKLDRSFVHGCTTDETKRTMCKYVVTLAHSAGLHAVAEGVENADDLQTVIDTGFDCAQGFVFAQALPRDGLVQLLETPTGWPGKD